MSRSKLMAIVFLTWKAALRYRFFWVMLVLLAFTVGGIPLLVKDDGSAEGMTQILITYTLSMITAILGAATLWVSAGSLATEIENHQLQMVVTKPIPRWQIWLGKWLGVMGMNFILLLFAGGVVYGMVEYRAKKLTRDALEQLEDRDDQEIYNIAAMSQIVPYEIDPETNRPKLDDNERPVLRDIQEVREAVAGIEEKRLRDTVLIARASIPVSEEIRVNNEKLEGWIESLKRQYLPVRLEQVLRMKNEAEQQRGQKVGELSQELDSYEILQAEIQIEEEIRNYSQVIIPDGRVQLTFRKPKTWKPDEDEKMILRVYFEDPKVSFKNDNRYGLQLFCGPADKPNLVRTPDGLTLDARTRHEFQIPTSLQSNREGGGQQSIFDENGVVSVSLMNRDQGEPNRNDRAQLKVPFLDHRGRLGGEGVELMYHEGGFSKNYLRALGIVFAWLGALAALGLFAASFMSFAMSAFACLGVLIISFCVGLMQDVVEEGTVMQTYTEGQRDSSYVDSYAVPAFKVMISMIKPVKDYSPIEKLTEGRSVTWGELMRAYGYIWGVSGLTLGLLGSVILSRRQLAITSTNGGGS
jgi:hypothetical protein